jgi:glycosyltransferase involved in cell wall biosynthesis
MEPAVSLVSVIMPTYNAAGWVAETIDNLIAQTYPHVELIVVDDRSTDDTVAVVRAKLARDFRNPWRIIELDQNGGPSAARNIGLRAARGDWVQFLDSDDLLAPVKFEREMAQCAVAAPDVTAVYSPWRRCYIDDGKITWEGPLIQPDMDGKAPVMCLVGGFRPLHPAGLARRSVLDRIGGFDAALRFWECEEINVRLAKTGPMLRVAADEPFYLWRVHRGKIYIGGAEARYRSAAVALGWIGEVLKATDGRPVDQLGLSAAARHDLLHDCRMWARLLYAQDRPAFHAYLAQARRLAPDLAPIDPKYIAMLTPYIGYGGAEGLARLWRMPRRRVRGVLRRLGLRPRNSVFDWD